jgi:hypothetical protein
MIQTYLKAGLLSLSLLIFSAGPAPAVENGATLVVGDTEITLHVLVIVGGIFFLVAVFIGLLVLYYRVGLPVMVFLIRVALPILFIGAAGMSIFAFLGWLAGQRLAIAQMLSYVGGLLGVLWGVRLFGHRNQETGPVRMSDFI